MTRRHLCISAVTLITACMLAQPALCQEASSAQTETDAQQSELRRREKQEQEQHTRRLIERFTASARDTSELLGRLQSKLAEHAPRFEKLLTSDEGKKIAQDPAAFMTFVRIQEEPVVTAEQIKARKATVDGVLQGLKEELKQVNVGFLPDEKTTREVNEQYFWAKERLGKLAEREAWLDTALSKAPKNADPNNAKTLQAVLREYNARILELWGKARTEGEAQAQEAKQKIMVETARLAEIERARSEAERMLRETRAQIESMKIEFEVQMKRREAEEKDRLAKAETKYQDLLAQLERDRKVADAKRKAKDVDAEIESKQVASEAEKKLLIQKCQDPEVKQLLAPFLTEGYWQPGEAANESTDKKPISLSKLKASGALEPSSDGLQKLLWVVSPKAGWGNNDKVRPRWRHANSPYSLSKLKPEQLEQLKTAQKHLRELGSVMVELKMLSE